MAKGAKQVKATQERPKVGAGIIVIVGSKILLSKRKGSHGSGMWGSAGGHVEHGERPSETVAREAREELGITLKNVSFLCCTDFYVDGKHYIDIGFEAEIDAGSPSIQPKERGKMEEVAWFPLDDLPAPLFPPIAQYLKARETGQVYFECR